jgi:hypothetical protein
MVAQGKKVRTRWSFKGTCSFYKNSGCLRIEKILKQELIRELKTGLSFAMITL